MESNEKSRRYRTVYKFMRIGSKEYAVLDPNLATQRADEYFERALKMLEDPKLNGNHEEINRALLLATDFGSKDAPFLIALRIIDPKVESQFYPEEVAVFLKTAAERGHGEAAYRLACCYADMGTFANIESTCQHYFTTFSDSDRSRLAEYYFNKASELGHQQAVEELIIAYAYGRGLIEKNAKAFVELCEQQIEAQNQAVTLGYGAWLAGMTVDGKAPLPNAVDVPVNYNKALVLLLLTCRGKNLGLAQHALRLICIGKELDLWCDGSESDLHDVLVKDAVNGNQILALYFAWYSIPHKQRDVMPKVLEACQLRELSEFVDCIEEDAIAYLDAAFFGPDADISAVAKEILSQVFGRCFMDEAGMLVFDEH